MTEHENTYQYDTANNVNDDNASNITIGGRKISV